MILNYQKRKNTELFKSLEQPNTLFLSQAQNYIPIYQRFFSLNETNYNHVNLNHKWYLSSIKENDSSKKGKEEIPDFDCKIKNINTQKTKSKEIFFKMAPLLDPFKYLVGKYDVNSPHLFKLPTFEQDLNVNPKFLDHNNSAYVDGFFVYLTSCLNEQHSSFVHGVDYYGSFLAIKNNYEINVFDDLDYLISSDFFNKNKGKLFNVDNFEHLFESEETKKSPIKIEENLSFDVPEFDETIFEELFDNDNSTSNSDLKDTDLVDMSNEDIPITDNNNSSSTIRSNSTCSSRTSHTSSEREDEEEEGVEEIEKDKEKEKEKEKEKDKEKEKEEEEEERQDNEEEDEDNSSSSCSEEEEEILKATIKSFPVQVIAMEFCEDTFDNLILSDDLTDEQWYSALMQIVMILITYQKCFSFTHNDLHTNNVMYNKTDKKFLYYCYQKKYYKVPTFGRIFKIIDFGRSIYKFDGKLFCSDSFQEGGDAASQYNTEPYMNDKKPRLEPNYSFDLCRLACSIFDYVVEDMEEIKNLKNCKDPIQRLIVEWCLDDKGVNLLYKNNGTDRYPDFKLYKMIARCVHNHTPQAQLLRPEFKSFELKTVPSTDDIIDIDKLPVYI
jgi:hypothetical protein